MRRLPKTKFKFFQGQMGFTLIEVLVGVAIISAIGVTTIRAVDTNIRAREILNEKVQATNLVTAYLEGIRQMPYSDNGSPYNSVGGSVVKPNQYIVAMEIHYSPDGISWYSNNSSGAYKLQRIRISVSREGGKPVLSVCTFKSPRIK
ncbi:MAG: type II secretion system protein [Chloroflexota bacterium]